MANHHEHQHELQTATMLRFAHELRRVKREAGEPSFRELYIRSSSRLTPATISRVLNGKAKATWFFTNAFLRACEISDDNIVTVWRPKWVHMMDVLQPLDSELDDDPPSAQPSDTTCADCGLVIGDLGRHQTWHDEKGKSKAQGTTLRPVPGTGTGTGTKPWLRRRKVS
jgi:hypothetical protein